MESACFQEKKNVIIVTPTKPKEDTCQGQNPRSCFSPRSSRPYFLFFIPATLFSNSSVGGVLRQNIRPSSRLVGYFSWCALK